jgi:predicted membrane protein
MMFGVILLVIGLLMIINILVPGFDINFNVIWPSAMIFVSLYQMIKNKIFNGGLIIMFYIGLFFLVQNLGIYGNIEELFLPLLFVVIGLTAIVGESINKKDTIVPTVNKEGILSYTAIFTEISETVSSKDFKGTNIFSLFGDCDLDFRDVKLKDDAVITVTSIFGGSNLIMPADCHVVMSSNAFFGGNENKCKDTEVKGAKTIYVNCTSFFGGTELK